MTCGASTVGQYSNAGDQLIFEMNMPFTGDLIFDASNSNFAISGIDAQTKLGSYLGSDSDNDGVISLNPAVVGDYKFIMTGASGGVYHVQIRCVSDEPTVFPTQSPTKTPSYAATNHPTRGPSTEPSVSLVTSKPTDTTGMPTDGPTDRPTKQPTSLTTSQSDHQGSDSDEFNGQGESADISDMRIAVYVMSSVIICCVCLCMMILFYKYCYGDMKKMVRIQSENHSNIVAVNSVDWTRPQVEVDFERDLVRQWLIHTVKLPMYEEKFFGQGYEDMRAIQAINSREQLARCGIKLDGHQTLIMAEIAALQGTQFGTSGDRTRGEGGGQAKNRDAFGGKLPPVPRMMGDDPANAQYVVNEGFFMTNVGDEEVSESDSDCGHATVTLGMDKVPPAADVPLVLDTPCWNGVGGPPMMSNEHLMTVEGNM
eukprot:659571_1